MKKLRSASTFAGGLALGVALMFCLGADKDKDAKKEWAQHLVFVGYSTGTTGIFDPSTGTIYMYDSNLQNCYLTRKLNNLGDPLIAP